MPLFPGEDSWMASDFQLGYSLVMVSIKAPSLGFELQLLHIKLSRNQLSCAIKFTSCSQQGQ